MTTSSAHWLHVERERARAFRERERVLRSAALRAQHPADFLARTKIEVPVGDVESARVPFMLWPAQREVLDTLIRERLIVFLKARQLGISWLSCGFVHYECTTRPGQPWLLFSQGQLEANELTRRIALMHNEHEQRAALPRLVKENTQELEWDNGSRVISLPATKRAGRSFTAAGVILDEWAFMLWGRAVLAAVKPTIDAGGKLIIISSADGNGTPYHLFWQAAKSAGSGYKAIFLPWSARPDRGPGWRDQKLLEANGDEAGVRREYPENDLEAFTNAAGLIYGEVWRDGPPDGNVTEDADYTPDAGPVYWALDDGYSAGSQPASAGKDSHTGEYVADAHPRVILLVQQRPDGRLCVFAESYACLKLSGAHIQEVLAMPYPAPDLVVHGPGAAEIRGNIHAAGLPASQSTAKVDESIKVLRSALAADANVWRKVLVHPRCRHLRAEMASYRYEPGGTTPIKAFDHGPDAIRGLCWVLRSG